MASRVLVSKEQPVVIRRAVGPVKVDHFISGSVKVGLLMNRLRSHAAEPSRWKHKRPSERSLPQSTLPTG